LKIGSIEPGAAQSTRAAFMATERELDQQIPLECAL
jgi:hypothetical protein